uniref:Uncharacterized protein n=1 Tax=Rhizophora mucronata TaxID=61149 RepID=A0A2P2NV78_RHIMU
MSIKLYGCHLS